MPTVLVTGAGGFVGQHLLRALLRRGGRVVGSTVSGNAPEDGVLTTEEKAAVDWVTLDVTRPDQLRALAEQARPGVVYHLAGQSSVGGSFADPLSTWEVNATGTLRLLHALGEWSPSPVRVLVVSSAEVYGTVPEREQPIGEDRPLRPGSPYGASKAAAEMVAYQASASEKVAVVVSRSFNHTGPGQDVRFALPNFARQLARIRDGAGKAVLRVGNLSARRDLLDVRDVVRAYLCLAERGANGEVYNVCSGRAHEMRAVVEELVRLSGTGTRIEVDPERFRPVDVPLLLGDPGRIRALGWQPEIPLQQTLRDVLEDAVDR